MGRGVSHVLPWKKGAWKKLVAILIGGGHKRY